MRRILSPLAVASFLFAGMADTGAQGRQGIQQSSDWMRRSEYQQEFDKNSRKGLYPDEVRSECQGGRERIRATWKPLPSGASFYAYSRMFQEVYERREAELRAKGYTRVWLNQFKDCQGDQRYQATWIRSASARQEQVALAAPTRASPAAVSAAEWMTSTEFRVEFERRLLDGLHPVELHGECRSGGERFRAAWKPSPPDATVLSYVGMSEALYAGRDSDFRSKGYSRVWVAESKDCAGSRKYQATWVKSSPR